jgi:hypothetical protein
VKRVFPLLVPILLVAVLAGCGDDSDDTTTISPIPQGPASLSQAAYVEQGDAICAEVNLALGSLVEAAADTSTQVEQEAALYQGMVDRLRSLPRPAEDAGLDQFFADGDALVQATQDALLAAQRGDDAGLAVARADVASSAEDFGQSAEAYGFAECGAGPTSPSATCVVPGATAPSGSVPVTPAPVPITPAPIPAPAPVPPPPSIGGGVGGEEPQEGDGTAGGGGTGGIGPG